MTSWASLGESLGDTGGSDIGVIRVALISCFCLVLLPGLVQLQGPCYQRCYLFITAGQAHLHISRRSAQGSELKGHIRQLYGMMIFYGCMDLAGSWNSPTAAILLCSCGALGMEAIALMERWSRCGCLQVADGLRSQDS